ncbi:unnamed protein product [Rotaria sordida]|uniref:SRCR domain-containing protein n=1 Tax=Rotaria sordida TaxID=392033 RepID=A0A818NFP4_9BILA|nr:unnamed protein product [Rotaria sordida]
MQFILSTLVVFALINSQSNAESLGENILRALQANAGNYATSRALIPWQQTCHNMFNLFASARSIAEITVQELLPLRIRVKIQLENPGSDRRDYFYVDGHVCQNGFNQSAANTVCRSLGKGSNSVYLMNRPLGDQPFDQCLFQYGADRIVIPCTFLMEQFNCAANAKNLATCQHTKMFEHQCAGDMYVGVVC